MGSTALVPPGSDARWYRDPDAAWVLGVGPGCTSSERAQDGPSPHYGPQLPVPYDAIHRPPGLPIDTVDTMFHDKRVAVLIPAYNEAHQIAGVLDGLPKFVDDVIVVDDGSTDATAQVVTASAAKDHRISLIKLPENRGVGGALAAAYVMARDRGVDVAVTVDGDGQMDPTEMGDLLMPIVTGHADYVKGNRLLDPQHWRLIPRTRLFGNAVLSLLTKLASGYWSVADSQTGYTAAGRHALDHIDWESVYPRYGRPNDVLIRANVAECRVSDVPISAIYGVGERSNMKILKVVFGISLLLMRRFWWRLFHRYMLRDFHPLVFFYLLSVVTGLATLALGVRLVVLWSVLGNVPQLTALAAGFFGITTMNSVAFATWMDMQANDHLNIRFRDLQPEWDVADLTRRDGHGRVAVTPPDTSPDTSPDASPDTVAATGDEVDVGDAADGVLTRASDGT